MGRWRPPAAKSSPYITQRGYDVLQEQLRGLWLTRREVVAALSAAAAEGDRSENAEYIYRKKQLGGIDRRIRYLQKRLPDLNIVSQHPTNEKVHFGAWVTVEREDGTCVEYRIVGADELDQHTANISIDAPVARAMLGKNPDDEIVVRFAAQEQRMTIRSVVYRD